MLIMTNTDMNTAKKQDKNKIKLKSKSSTTSNLPLKKKNNNGNSNNAQSNRNSNNQRFFCNYPNCNKSFTRLEHLSRHNLNHWPKKIFECSFIFPDTNMKCGKTFVRRDLLIRHERRHANENNRLVSKKNKQLKQLKIIQDGFSSATTKNAISDSNTNLEENPNANNQLNNMGTSLSRDSLPTISSIMPSYSNVNFNSSSMFSQGNNNGNIQSYDQFFDWVFDNNDNKNHHYASSVKNNVDLNTANFNNNLVAGNIPNNQSTVKNQDQKLLGASNSIVDNANILAPIPQNTYPSISNLAQFDSTKLIEVFQQPNPIQKNTVGQYHESTYFNSNMNISQNGNITVTQNNNINSPPESNRSSITSSVQNHKQEHQHLLHPLNSHVETQLQGPSLESVPPKLQDLYSLDYLASDPLQRFMQELSAMYSGEINNITNENNLFLTESNNDNNIMSNGLDNIFVPPSMPISVSNNSSNFIHTPGSLTDSRMASLNNIKVDNDILINDSTTSLISTPSKAKPNKIRKSNHSIPKLQALSADSRGNSTKNNYLVKHSNINQLKKQPLESDNTSMSSSKFKTLKMINSKKELLESMKNVPSIFFPDPKTKYQLSKEKCEELYNLIPEIRNIQYETLEISLKSYWKNFHPQHGLLHKPSFNVNQQPPILIISLIMTGASYLGVDFRKTVSDPICGPLRWIIFAHPDFQPPSSTYIILSLLLLESYEKTSTNRYFHERSYLHHGTTIQLLRRTPSLGGHPLRDKTNDPEVDDDGTDGPNELNRVLNKWIEFESLKRVAFFAFYMDVTHAIVFGYMNLFISFRQIQLDLPCPDKIWESYDLSFEVLKESGYGDRGDDQSNNQTFLFALKKLIRDAIDKMITDSNKDQNDIEGIIGDVTGDCNKSFEISSQNSGSNDTDRYCDNVSGTLHLEELKKWKQNHTSAIYRPMTSVLGKKLMLAGILSVMFQCQEENDDPLIANVVIDGFNDHNITWKEIISFAINYWMFEVQRDCHKEKNCSLIKEISRSESNENVQGYPNYENPLEEKVLQVTAWNNNDDDCKLPVYHMSQIILRIFHHDYYISAGAPWRMNVMIGDKEFQSIQQRMIQFSKDTYTGGVTIIYAFQFLFEMFVRKDSITNEITIDKNYDINTDIISTRPNSIALVTLLIWTYTFTLYGPEIVLWDNEEDNEECDSNKNEKLESRKKKNDELQLKYVPIESFESYLIRMYDHLYIEKDSGGAISYQRRVWRKAVLLQTISGQNNTIGFIKYIKEILEKSYWDLTKELSRLLNNCIQRSLGKKTHVCHDMYDV